MFFAISGFLITSLLLNEKKNNGNINLRLFFVRRFLRLLPPIIPFYVALFVFMKLGYVRETYIGLTASILYLFNFIPKAKFIYSHELAHTWSLAVEEQFYLAWALIFRYVKFQRIYSIVIVVIFISVCFSYLLPQIKFTYDGIKYYLDEVAFVKRWIIPGIAPILIGALIAMLNFKNFLDIRTKFKQKKFGVIALLIFISPFYLPYHLFPVIRIIHGLGSALILLWICHNQKSKIVKILELPLFRYIGIISYGLYIWQGFFVRNDPFSEPKIWVHEFPVNIFLTFFVAIISYEFYEKRILLLKKKMRSTTPNVPNSSKNSYSNLKLSVK